MENDCAAYWFWFRKLIVSSHVSLSLAKMIPWFGFSGNIGTSGRMQNTECSLIQTESNYFYIALSTHRFCEKKFLYQNISLEEAEGDSLILICKYKV